MLSVKNAEATILNSIKPLDNQKYIEFVDLLTVSNRILATPISSHLDFPHWDNSAMDGFAVRYADVLKATAEKPTVDERRREHPTFFHVIANETKWNVRVACRRLQQS